MATNKNITFQNTGKFEFDDYANKKFIYNHYGILKTKGNIILKKNGDNSSNLSKFNSLKIVFRSSSYFSLLRLNFLSTTSSRNDLK